MFEQRPEDIQPWDYVKAKLQEIKAPSDIIFAITIHRGIVQSVYRKMDILSEWVDFKARDDWSGTNTMIEKLNILEEIIDSKKYHYECNVGNTSCRICKVNEGSGNIRCGSTVSQLTRVAHWIDTAKDLIQYQSYLDKDNAEATT